MLLHSGQVGAVVVPLSAVADQAQWAHQEVVGFLVSPLCAGQAEVVFLLLVSVPADQVIVITGRVIVGDMAGHTMVPDLVSEGLITDLTIVITVFTDRF